MHYKTSISLLGLLLSIIVYSQKESSFIFQTGVGYYEGFHGGIQYSYFSQHATSLSIGFDMNVFSEGTLVSLIIEHDYGWIKNTQKDNLYSWTIQGKASIWYLEDEFYKWHVLSLSPAINRNFNLSPKIWISLDTGPVFNIVLANHRKTFEEVGWPKSVSPNARLLFHYRF